MLSRALFACVGLSVLDASIAEAGDVLKGFSQQFDPPQSLDKARFTEILGAELALMHDELSETEETDYDGGETDYDGGKTYCSFKSLIESRFFFSWHFKALNFKSRMNLATGIYNELVDIFNDINDGGADKDLVCTEENYRTFINRLDGILFEARNLEALKNIDFSSQKDGAKDQEDGTKGQEDGTKDQKDGTKGQEDGTKNQEDGAKDRKNKRVWERLNELWNTSFYLWFYMDKMQDLPQNAYPAQISIDGYIKNQEIVDKNVVKDKNGNQELDLTHYNAVSQDPKLLKGIKNPGNQCYANATMQALQAIPVLNSKIHTFLETTHFKDGFQWAVNSHDDLDQWMTNSYEGGLQWLTKELGFDKAREQDASEFLMKLIEKYFTNAEKNILKIENDLTADCVLEYMKTDSNYTFIEDIQKDGNILIKNINTDNGVFIIYHPISEKGTIDPLFTYNEKFCPCDSAKIYKIRSMVVYKGRHYAAIVRYGEKWFYVSDKTVVEGEIREEGNGELAFYDLKNGRLCSLSPTLLFYSVMTPDEDRETP